MNIYIRTNFNNKIGLGHIKRTLRIAKEFKNRGHDCFFYVDELNPKITFPFKKIAIYSKNQKYFNEIQDAKLFLDKLKKKKLGIVILDDYRLSFTWEKHVSSFKHKIIVFDDLENKKHYADIIINYNPKNYPIIKYNLKNNKKRDCQFLIHPKYNVISNEKVISKINKKIFNISFYIGGGNNLDIIYNLIKEILKNIKNKKINLTIIIGPLAKNYKKIIDLSIKNKQLNCLIKPNNLSNTIKNSQIFVGSSGTTIFETAFFKTPSILVRLTKNQDTNIFSLEKLGHYFFINKKEFLSSKKMTEFILLIYKNYHKFKLFIKNPEIKIDNKGCERIVDQVFFKKKKTISKIQIKDKVFKKENLKIRPINDKDINHYLHSRNLEINKRNSTNKKKFSSLSHYIWWFKTNRKSYVLLRDKEKVLYFYEEKILQYNDDYYNISGWFACSKNCSIKEILYALKWQHTKSKRKVRWISFIKKTNKLSILMSKYIGWIKLNPSDEIIKKITSEYDINKNEYLFYKR